MNKYEPLRQTMLGRFESVEVFPFVIGSLGSWFLPNDGVLKRLRLARYAALMRRLCVASAIAGLQDIWFHSACSRPNTNIPSRLQPDDPPSPCTHITASINVNFKYHYCYIVHIYDIHSLCCTSSVPMLLCNMAFTSPLQSCSAIYYCRSLDAPFIMVLQGYICVNIYIYVLYIELRLCVP